MMRTEVECADLVARAMEQGRDEGRRDERLRIATAYNKHMGEQVVATHEALRRFVFEALYDQELA